MRVQAYLQELKTAGKLRRVWNDDTYDQALANPQRSYLGDQATLLNRALAGFVENDGTPKAVPYTVAGGPVIPTRWARPASG